MPELLDMPAEIINRICRFVGREFDPSTQEIFYRDQDFYALRLTCQELYSNTLYDASMRFPLKFLKIAFNYPSLVTLIRLTKARYIRDRIRRVHLVRDYGNRRDELVQTVWDRIRAMIREEEATNFTRSGEAVYMLAQCLRNLRGANLFDTVMYEDGFPDVIGQAAVFEAVIAAQLPREDVVRLSIDLRYIQSRGGVGRWGDITDIVGVYRPLIRDAVITAPVFKDLIIPPRNRPGFHNQNFRLTHQKLDRVKDAIEVDSAFISHQ
ncbi:uncharacterized protein K460DRAFT_413015 [Cucurbitaria berberidis CBS 394.84]|uniref:Uncharacterized protein n=1 Tax=Cucurbitaria berberidis CBS 394.84 TaxID=1168544 RepID=A0A9P4GU93_9PLEO|nr:uncharacterized protein K460DRAFT_413015 [Cucurbitaria berberidis CBS 394.84]KAF1851455.1 hypothetical protein K460DRAFT_413015 [Cucurbitaria berberidis CBS 394.84]